MAKTPVDDMQSHGTAIAIADHILSLLPGTVHEKLLGLLYALVVLSTITRNVGAPPTVVRQAFHELADKAFDYFEASYEALK